MPLILAIGAPALAATLYALLGWQRATAWLGAAAAATVLSCGLYLTAAGATREAGALLHADALSAFMLIVIGAVALLACLAGPVYIADETAAGKIGPRAARWYGILTSAFIAAMALAVLAASLGVLWIAVEATTILTAFLVGFRRTRRSVEAAWKYVTICSVGIALALLGIVLLQFGASEAGVSDSLDIAALTRHAASLDPGITRMAVALIILGFGTKAGLAPMHAWLPDAHSQAPAPVSALMSGVLLSVAFYAVLRAKAIADMALGTDFARTLLLIAALASIVLAAAMMIAQRDYKRLLAYSSIEHMGLIALGTAIGGPLAQAAVLLHILGHGLAKSTAFLAAGQILARTGTTRIDRVHALTARFPFLGGAFALALAALAGLPPFSLFASELGLVRSGFGAGLGWAVALGLAGLLIAAAAMAFHGSKMLLGPSVDRAAHPAAQAVPLLVGLAAAAVVGVAAVPLDALVDGAVDAIGGTE